MTKKHFQQIAAILARAYRFYPEQAHTNAIDYIREELESMCKQQNPNFDVARFRKACGFSERN